jgi:hypothetical protein
MPVITSRSVAVVHSGLAAILSLAARMLGEKMMSETLLRWCCGPDTSNRSGTKSDPDQ